MGRFLYWLSVPNSTRFTAITYNCKSNHNVNPENMRECIWWEKDEREEAKQFLTELKEMLVKYKKKHPDRAQWMTGDWLEVDLQ